MAKSSRLDSFTPEVALELAIFGYLPCDAHRCQMSFTLFFEVILIPNTSLFFGRFRGRFIRSTNC